MESRSQIKAGKTTWERNTGYVSCLAAVTLGLLGLAASQQYDKSPGRLEPQESPPESQIDANNPETSEFVRILRRDVSQFLLDNKYPSTNVSIAMLRDSPTQVGVSYANC